MSGKAPSRTFTRSGSVQWNGERLDKRRVLRPRFCASATFAGNALGARVTFSTAAYRSNDE